jgi:hypothetical protein
MILLLWHVHVFGLHSMIFSVCFTEKSEADLAEKPEAVDVVLPPTYERLALQWVLIYS